MILETSQLALEALKQKPNQKAINSAIYHESRLRLHTLSNVDNQFIGVSGKGLLNLTKEPSYRQLIEQLKITLPPDKFNTVVSLLLPPFNSQKVVKRIFSEFEKIFDAQNSHFDYDFKEDEQRHVFEAHLNKIKDSEFWQQEGIEAIKHQIHGVLIVDLPRRIDSVNSDIAQPYYYILELERLIGIELNKINDIVEYVCFYTDATKKEKAVYCDKYYRVFDSETDAVITESEHNLGYCPAKMFIPTLLNRSTDLFQREGVLSSSLTDLDKYLKWDIFKEYADMYGAFPILVTVKQNCTVPNCVDGVLVKTEKTLITGVDGIQREEWVEQKDPCPSCSGVQSMGPGSVYKVAPRIHSEDPVQPNPVEIVSPDVKNLEYLDQKLKKLEDSVFHTIIGAMSVSPNDKQFNEQQVKSLYDQKINALMNLKRIFEENQTWTASTMAKLMYGDAFIGCSIYYGDEFYLKSIVDIATDYSESKESGEPDEELHTIYMQKLATKYRGNPTKLKRMKLLAEINPFPHKTDEEVAKLVELGIATIEDQKIKANFTRFIQRFERENGNILNFGEALDYYKKIEAIQEVLIGYANEIKQVVNNNPDGQE